MLYLYVYIAIRVLINILLFLVGISLIMLILSVALGVLIFIINAVNVPHSQAFSEKSLKVFNPLKIVKFSILAMAVMFIAYLGLNFTNRFILNKLNTDSLSNYSGTEWVSEDGKILISVDSSLGKHPTYKMDEDGYIFSYATQGICRIGNEQDSVEYELYGKFQGVTFSLYLSDDEPERHISTYLINGDTFYAVIRDDEQLLGKILKFYRLYD